MNKKIFAITIIGILCISNIVMISTADEEITIDIEIKEGWNLITIPVDDDMNASGLADRIENCTMISRWDYEEQTYESYIPGWNGFDFQIEDGYGYYVYATSESTLSVTGVQLEDVDVEILEGYNLLGRYESEKINASEIMNSIENCVLVKSWDLENQEYRIYESSDDPDFAINQSMGYFIEISDEENEEDDEDPEFVFDFNLIAGENLITIPVENDYNASDLADIIENCIHISKWDAELQTYKTYMADNDAFDFRIEDGHGYFINVGSDSTFSVSGELITDADVEILEGYNLLGHYQEDCTTASEIMNSIENCTQIKIFNESIQDYIYYNGSDDEDFEICQGMGYFILIEPEEPEEDITPPETEIIVNGREKNGEWYSHDVEIRLSATDDMSGVKKTLYCIDRGEYVEYTDSFKITSDGETVISFHSVDNAGNIEEIKKHTIKIDKTAPKTKSVLPPTILHFMGIPIYLKPIDVKLIADDSGSGVKTTYYRFKSNLVIDNTWNVYTDPITVEENGRHNIEFYSVDNVGNREGKDTVSFIVINRGRIFNSE